MTNQNDPLNAFEMLPKIYEILDSFGVEYSVHKDPEDYPYLAEYDICIGVSNPTGGETLYIAVQDWVCGEFIMGFGIWHMHYLGYVFGYEYLVRDMRKILSGETAILFVCIKNDWKILDSISAGDSLTEKLDDLGEPYLEKLKELGGVIKTFWWDTSKNTEYNVRNGENNLWIITQQLLPAASAAEIK